MGLNKKREFIFISIAPQGIGISGGDRIFIELARRWSRTYPVSIYTWKEGIEMCRRQGLVGGDLLAIKDIKVNISSTKFLLNYFLRILIALKLGLTLKLKEDTLYYIYSSSEFWMDSLPALILKRRYPRIIWLAAWYQTAPSPWKGFASGERKQKYRLNAFFYWFMQLPIKPLINHFADLVLVNNEDERRQFPRLYGTGKTLVVIGAVDLEARDEYREKFKGLPKIYDSVFQGRFHPQKGVVELIEIWRKVVSKRPQAKLVMIGDGPLMAQVKSKIREYRLEKNIQLSGYLFDGPQKYKIFNQSKVVVHPAFFDSGGMAAAEAMMFNLPCIGFDLKSYKFYYPKGMVKVKMGDLDEFANEVVKLLKDDSYRTEVAEEAVEMIEKNWSWDKRSEQLLNQIFK